MKIDDISHTTPGFTTVIEGLAYARYSEIDTKTDYGFNDGVSTYRCKRSDVDAYVESHGSDSTINNDWYSNFCNTVNCTEL